jgi:hypothetical protein
MLNGTTNVGSTSVFTFPSAGISGARKIEKDILACRYSYKVLCHEDMGKWRYRCSLDINVYKHKNIIFLLVFCSCNGHNREYSKIL